MVKGDFNSKVMNDIFQKIGKNLDYLLKHYKYTTYIKHDKDYETTAEEYLNEAYPQADFSNSVYLDSNKMAFIFYLDFYALKDGLKYIGKMEITKQGWQFYPMKAVSLTNQ